jgi:hypothetical protein
MGLQMKALIALSVGACALLWSGNIPLNKATSGATSLVSTAEARVDARGRPVNRSAPVKRADRHRTRSYH